MSKVLSRAKTDFQTIFFFAGSKSLKIVAADSRLISIFGKTSEINFRRSTKWSAEAATKKTILSIHHLYTQSNIAISLAQP